MRQVLAEASKPPNAGNANAAGDGTLPSDNAADQKDGESSQVAQTSHDESERTDSSSNKNDAQVSGVCKDRQEDIIVKD